MQHHEQFARDVPIGTRVIGFSGHQRQPSPAGSASASWENGAVGTVRVLLSEGSSLTARETVTCLGRAGYHLEVLDPDRFCVTRFSRWVKRVHRCPPAGTDPHGYLEAVRTVIADRRIDVLLPTHEQTWLFAAARPQLSGVPVMVADIADFDRVQSKVEFARLLDELSLPQPEWRLINSEPELAGVSFPYWLKTPFSTAGRGVRLVIDEPSRAAAAAELLGRPGGPAMAQRPAVGEYGQVQGLFDRGRLVAVHTSVQIGTGIGPSAAARLSVDHPLPRAHIAQLGDVLSWHGGLTLDYLHRGGVPQYIECNPRTVEPGNATASGVNVQQLQVRLTLGQGLPSRPVVGRAGVRTHGALALILGAAAYEQSRRAVMAQVAHAVFGRGCYRDSAEQLTPVTRDPPSAVALAFVTAQAIGSPARASRLASQAVGRYSITPEAIASVRAPAAQR